MYGQDAAEDRVVVYLDARAVLEWVAQLGVVLGPGDVQRLIALAARAHQLGAHSLGNVVLEVERRYAGRDCMGRDSIYTSTSSSSVSEQGIDQSRKWPNLVANRATR